MENVKRKIAVAVTALLVFVLMLPVTAMAAEPINTSQDCSITVKLAYTNNNNVTTNIQNVRVTLYQVALIRYPDGVSMAFTKTAAFAGSTTDVTQITDADQNQAAAAALLAYANAATPVIQGTTQTTDVNGGAVFSGLKPGIYLIAPGYAANYEAIKPFLAVVPSYDASGYHYDLTATPKTELVPIPTTTPTTTHYYPPPPTTTPYTTPTSTPTTGTTTATQPSTVITQPSTEGGSTTQPVTQPSTRPTTPATTPQTSTQPTGSGNQPGIGTGGQNDYGGSSQNSSGGGGGTPGSKLPQTGMLNWPIPVMSGGGLLIFSAGFIVLRKNKKDDKDEKDGDEK